MTDLMTLSVSGATLSLDPYVGGLRDLCFDAQAVPIHPLHQMASPDRLCRGDCCGSARQARAWLPDEIWQSGAEAMARLSLAHPLHGARIEKELRLRSDEPILYQTLRITGGRKGLNVAHHPVIQIGRGARLSFSPKQEARTGSAPCAGFLQYPARSDDLRRFPGTGGPVDLHNYPARTAREDTVHLQEARGSDLGWTAIVRGAEDDVIFILKDPRILPVTTLSYASDGSNWGETLGGGGVLGVQDTMPDSGAMQSLPAARDRQYLVRQAIGAMRRPSGWTSIADIRTCGAQLQLMGSNGQTVRLPFDRSFFGLPSFPDTVQ